MEQNNLIQGDKNHGKEFFILRRNIYPFSSSTLTILLFSVELRSSGMHRKKNIKNGTEPSRGKLRLFCPINQRKTNISFSSFRGHFKEKNGHRLLFIISFYPSATKGDALKVIASKKILNIDCRVLIVY